MALTKSFVAVAMFSSIALASPAFAQAHSRGGGGGGHQSGGGGNRGGGGGSVARSYSAPAPSRAPVYNGGARSYSGPMRSYSGPGPVRSYSAPAIRSYSAPAIRSYGGPGAVPRYSAPPRVYSPRVYSPGYYGGRVYSPRYYAAPRVYGPVYRSYGYHFYGYPSYVYRPYFFRPHFSIGFGFFVGYPVPYSYAYPEYYPYPVPYPAPYPAPYGYPTTGYPPDYQQGSVTAAPGPEVSGGVSFEVNPPTAQVYADGQYVGTVESFDGTKQPLTLATGQHRLELRCQGYETVTFDVNVLAGQVIPYRGDLRPAGTIY